MKAGKAAGSTRFRPILAESSQLDVQISLFLRCVDITDRLQPLQFDGDRRECQNRCNLVWRTNGELLWYPDFVPLKSCRVMFMDKEGVNHDVSVQADSLFEAVALALRGFRDDSWSAEGSHWTGALEIVVQQPAVTHKVSLEKFHSFLESKGGSPRDITRREKLNRILDGK